jgi:hypothetical protein
MNTDNLDLIEIHHYDLETQHENERLVAAEIIENGMEGFRDCPDVRFFFSHLAFFVRYQGDDSEEKAIIFDALKDALMGAMTDHYPVQT